MESYYKINPKKKRKIYQRKFTKLIREYNQALDKDNLWLGRFQIYQIRSRWENFDDGSGGILHSVVRCFDKKTRRHKDFFIEYSPWIKTIHWKIGVEILNTFIVEDIDVWKNENPRKEVVDWTNVKIPYKEIQKNSNKYITNNYMQLVRY